MNNFTAKELISFLKETSKIVDPKIREILNLYVSREFRSLVNYQIKMGGKRLRPALAFLSSFVCGGKEKDILYPAAGLEILHNYTLIIDDIIDDSPLRRGKPTVWDKYGKSMAECLEVYYAAAIFQAANNSKKPSEVSDIFSKALKIVFEGEILDILFEQSGREEEEYINENRYNQVSRRDYLKMISKKTASLMEASCEVGAISTNASKEQTTALKNYGFNLGVAFQIQDDILDIFGNQKKFGKPIGQDIRERKLGNIVIFYALEELPLSKRKTILSVLRKKKRKEEDIKRVIKIIKNTQAREKATFLGQKYLKKAKNNLKNLPQNKWNEALETMADFVIGRER